MGRVCAAIALVCAVVLGVGATPTEAADGISLSSASVYRLDPDRPAVEIETTYRMTNVTPDEPLGGGRYEYYYFTGISLPIDPSASEITVEINGRDGDFTVEEEDGFPYLDVNLGYELRYQKTATIVVRSVLLGDPPRDPDTWVRVNPAYASFEVYAWGDDGQVDVRIETPESWATDYVGSDLSERVEDGVRVHEAVDIEAPRDWGVLFTARNDELLDSSEVRVGDASFEVRSWPGDEAWLSFATEQIQDGVPALEALLDTPWPVADEVEVIEASTPYLSGYAGFYDSSEDVIEIGEELDRHTFLHELAHAWVNGDGFRERWIIEGLAEEISARGLVTLGDPLPDTRSDAALRDEGVEFEPFPLNTWTSFSADEGVEDYGYAASARVTRALYDEIGAEAMTELLSALIEGHRAYPDEDGPVLTNGRRVGWQTFLDLAEQIGGSTGLEQQYRDLVLTASQVDTLDRRDEVVAAYDELLQRGGSWYPPVVVRDRLAQWQLERTMDEIEQAHALLDERDALWDTLAPIGLTSPESVELAYQASTDDEDEIAAELRDLIANAELLVAARGELAATLGTIDQDVPELRQAEYEESPESALDRTDASIELAAELVATLDELAGVLADHELSVPPLDTGAFAHDPAMAQELVDERLVAAVAVDGAHDRRESASGLLESIGAWRSDVDEVLAEADALLADGDTDGAVEAAARAADRADRFDDVGLQRLAIVGGGLVLVLLVGAALVVRRRRRPTSQEGPAEVSTDGSADGSTGGSADGSLTVLPPPGLDDQPMGVTVPAPGAAESGDVVADPSAGEADAGEAGPVDPRR